MVNTQLSLDSPPRVDGSMSEVAYRPVSMMAVLGCLLGALSLTGLYAWFLLFLPIFAVIACCLALWSIRRSDGDLTGRGIAIAGIVLAIVSFSGGVSYQVYTYNHEVPPGYQRISFVEDISKKPIRYSREHGIEIPKEIMDMDGKRIFLKGYIFPSSEMTMTEFLLLKDMGQCCFGGKPPLTDRIGVKIQGDQKTRYFFGCFAVGGIFRVNRDFKNADPLEPLYTIEADIAEPAHSDF